MYAKKCLQELAEQMPEDSKLKRIAFGEKDSLLMEEAGVAALGALLAKAKDVEDLGVGETGMTATALRS